MADEEKPPANLQNGLPAAKQTPTQANTTGEMSRPNNLQRIAQKKALVRSYPRTKKLEKLAVYSSCKTDGCKCKGWKKPNPPPTPPRVDVSQPLANLTDPCRSCTHTLDAHVSHLKNTAEEELNRLLHIVVDVENLFMCVHKEEDAETKQVYFNLFQLLRKCILNMSNPTIEGPLGKPPFEKPSIAKGVTNFVLYKFGHLAQRDLQTMYDLAKMFLHCLNHWKLETPTSRQAHAGSDDIATYKVNYTMWLCYCHVPAFCDTLPRYETTLIFGRTLLQSVFQTMRRQLLEKFRAEKDRMPVEKITLVLTHFPMFLYLLEEEVYGESSPIWDTEFSQANANSAGVNSDASSIASSDKSDGKMPGPVASRRSSRNEALAANCSTEPPTCNSEACLPIGSSTEFVYMTASSSSSSTIENLRDQDESNSTIEPPLKKSKSDRKTTEELVLEQTEVLKQVVHSLNAVNDSLKLLKETLRQPGYIL